MAVKSEPVAASDREIVISRVLDAPRELAFAAWTDPQHVTHWWGPRGFTTTTSEMDVRPGGVWRFVMHGPDGVDYQNKIVYLEVVRPERLVYRHSGEGETADVKFQSTVTFDEQGGKTRLTLRLLFETAEERDAVVEKRGAIEGGKQTLERFAEHLADTAAREIVSSRVFDAPRELVFQAFRDPDRLARWWGPKGFTNTIHEFDPRPGGAWRLTMHGPDGNDHLNESVFVEVAEPERVVFEHREPVHRFRMTLVFAGQNGRTDLTWRMLFDSAEECARVREVVAETNEQNFDRLAGELATRDPAGEAFVISRTFDAPRELVFRAWTEIGHLTRWFGPVGFTTAARENDLRPGGVFHYQMRAANGQEMWGKWVYREIAPPERLVFVQSFSDESGGTARAPFSDTFPLEWLSTVTFAEHDGRTTLTMRAVPLSATETERKTFVGMHGSMQKGWGGTLEKLAGHLAKGRAE